MTIRISMTTTTNRSSIIGVITRLTRLNDFTMETMKLMAISRTIGASLNDEKMNIFERKCDHERFRSHWETDPTNKYDESHSRSSF